MRSWMIAYVVGVVIFHFWGIILPVACSILLLVISLAVFLFQSRIRWLSFLLVSIVWSSVYSDSNKNKALDHAYESKNLFTSGYVCSIPKQTDAVVSFELCDSSIRYKPGSPMLAEGLRLKLSWYASRSTHIKAEHPSVKNLVGQQAFIVRLKRPHGMVNPYGFMYEKWLFRKGINAVGYVKQPVNDGLLTAKDLNPSPNCKGSGLNCDITALRISINNYLSSLSDELPHIPLIKALSVGFRGDINPDSWALFKNTGTQHLIAISGLHIGLVFGMAMGIFALFWRVINVLFARSRLEHFNVYKQYSCVLFALLCALSYSAMAGFLVSTQRALIMLVVYYACGLSRRDIKANTRLLVAATVVLLLDPNAVLDYGFWLSFMAVWVLFFTTVRDVKDTSGKVVRWFKVTVSMQWVIFVGLCPVLLFSGMGVSYTSLLANFVAIPLVGMVTVPIILAGLVMFPFSSWLSEQLMYLANMSIEVLFEFLAFFRHFEALNIIDSSIVNAIAISIISLVVIILPIWNGIKTWLVLTVVLFLWFKPSINHNNSTEVVILDVGQGLSVVAVNGNRAIVYDTGPAYRVGSAAQRSLVPYLMAKGISHIEMVVVSHGDDDHSGGLLDLEQSFSIGRIITGQPERLETQRHLELCQNKVTIKQSWYSATFYYLPELSDRALSSNNQSCVVKLSLAGRTVLLMGDIEKRAERLLVKHYGHELKADILIAGHHGSKNATSQYLIDHVKPSQVIFSAGYKSRFNHPHPDAVSRAASNGASIFNTAEAGAVVIQQLDDDKWTTSAYRQKINAFWLF